MMVVAPSARPSMAAARPTGPSPVISSRSWPLTLHPPQRLVGRAEAAGAEGTVDEGERVGQADAGGLLGQQVRGVPAVALPAVSGPEVGDGN